MLLFTVFSTLLWSQIISNSIAESTTYSSPESLFNNLGKAHAGDVLTLEDGFYTYDADINIKTSGITIQAFTKGGVVFTLSVSKGLHFKITGSQINFIGFQFINGFSVGGGVVIDVTGSNNTFSELIFFNFSAKKYINIKAPSQYNIITNSNFEYKPYDAPSGNLIEIAADENVIGYHKITHCSFQNMPGAGGDFGNENIRIGEGSQSTFIARSIVEYCVFNNTGLGDSVCIYQIKRKHYSLFYFC
jgi:hypothetical protein